MLIIGNEISKYNKLVQGDILTSVDVTDPDNPIESLIVEIIGGNLDPDGDGNLAFLSALSFINGTWNIIVNDPDDLNFANSQGYNLEIRATDPLGASSLGNVDVIITNQVQTIILPEPLRIKSDRTLKFTVQYESTDPTVSFLTSNLHFDSNALEFVGVTDIFTTNLSFPNPNNSSFPNITIQDNNNLDANTNTDTIYRTSWTDATENWPGQTNINLYTISFKVPQDISLNEYSTIINFTGTPSSNFGLDVPTNILITVNYLPIFTGTFGPFTIKEKSPVGTVVGSVTASDPDNDILSYSIIAGNNSIDDDNNLAFAIDSNTGLITVNDTNDLIFNIQSSFTLTVQATDTLGESSTTDIIVNLNDITSPIVTIDPLISNDNTPTLTGTIDDSLATITVVVNGNSYNAVNNHNTWTVDIIDTIPDGIYDVSVTATDSVENVGVDNTTNELIIDTTAPIVTIDPLISNDNTPILTGTIDDSLATITVVVNGIGYIPNISENTWFVDITNFLTDNIYDVVVTATDLAGNIGQDNTINELTINQSPVIESQSFTINEKALLDSQIGIMTGSDPSNDILSYAIINGNKDIDGDGNLPFNITSDTGIITVNDTDDLVFNINPIFSLIIAVNDQTNDPVTTTATINLNKVQELVAEKGEDQPMIRQKSSFIIQQNKGIIATQTITFFNSEPSNAFANDTLFNNENQRLYGGNGDNYLIANKGDILFGGNGNDTLDGSQGVGNNYLFGGVGNDILIGGKGDILVGGSGNDLFKLVNNSLAEKPVIILDFNTNNDKIDLSKLTINGEKITFGNLIFDDTIDGKIALKVAGREEAISLIMNINKAELLSNHIII